jgi:hypothetical protein
VILPLLRSLRAVLALCLALGSAVSVGAAEPAPMILLFTGNTYGNYEPCPS